MKLDEKMLLKENRCNRKLFLIRLVTKKKLWRKSRLNSKNREKLKQKWRRKVESKKHYNLKCKMQQKREQHSGLLKKGRKKWIEKRKNDRII